MKKLLVFVSLNLLLLSLGYGQSVQATKIQAKRTLYNTEQQQVNEVAKPATESAYFGYDNQIKEISIGNSIPVGFPTKEGFNSREEYKTLINKWVKNNPSFIKPEHKETVITNK